MTHESHLTTRGKVAAGILAGALLVGAALEVSNHTGDRKDSSRVAANERILHSGNTVRELVGNTITLRSGVRFRTSLAIKNGDKSLDLSDNIAYIVPHDKKLELVNPMVVHDKNGKIWLATERPVQRKLPITEMSSAITAPKSLRDQASGTMFLAFDTLEKLSSEDVEVSDHVVVGADPFDTYSVDVVVQDDDDTIGFQRTDSDRQVNNPMTSIELPVNA